MDILILLRTCYYECKLNKNTQTWMCKQAHDDITAYEYITSSNANEYYVTNFTNKVIPARCSDFELRDSLQEKLLHAKLGLKVELRNSLQEKITSCKLGLVSNEN